MGERVIHPLKGQRGVVLVVALLVLTVLSVLGLAFLTTARTEDTIAANYRNHTAAFYAAEAGVESGVASLKTLVTTTPVPTDLQLAGILGPALTDPNYTFDAFQVTRMRTAQPYSYTSSIASGTFSGLVAQRTDYVVTAQVTGPRGSRARLSQTIQYMQIPLFQFAVFYGRGVDLEITPSPPMIIKGRVHANSNLHTLARTSLQYDERVTTSGHIYHYIKRDPTDRGTDPTIKAADATYKSLNFDFEYGPGLTPWTPAEWKDHALQTFGGTVQDKEMGVKDLNLPLPDLLTSGTPDVVSHQIIEKGSVGDSQALKDAKLYYQADLRIVDDKAYDKAGNSVNINGCKDANNKQAVRKESFWDNREKLTMQVTQIDVGALTACGVMPTNGILYASARPGSPNKGDGVRLVNGAQLPSQGLTVVSDDPVYIRGDYNTKDKKGNLRTAATPAADLISAAVMGDAITVLSNNWENNKSDTKGKDPISARPATDTTVNAAFMLGPAIESVPGEGNGQLENVIRLLEGWSGKTLNYSGSIVSLWHSQYAQGMWGCCGSSPWHYYQPPNRNWAFDTTFLTNPPPGTPMVIEIVRGQWSQM